MPWDHSTLDSEPERTFLMRMSTSRKRTFILELKEGFFVRQIRIEGNGKDGLFYHEESKREEQLNNLIADIFQNISPRLKYPYQLKANSSQASMTEVEPSEIGSRLAVLLQKGAKFLNEVPIEVILEDDLILLVSNNWMTFGQNFKQLEGLMPELKYMNVSAVDKASLMLRSLFEAVIPVELSQFTKTLERILLLKGN